MPGAAAPTPPTELERLVRAALGATAAALAGGVVASQYVGVELFAHLAPFVVGVLVAAAAQAASDSPRTGPPARRLRLLAAAYSLVAVALGFRIEQSQDAFGTGALVPYAAALAGVVLWTLPPARPRDAGGG